MRDACLLEGLALLVPAHSLVKTLGALARVAQQQLEAQVAKGTPLDLRDEAPTDALGLSLRIDGHLHEPSLTRLRVIGKQTRASNDPVALWVVDDGDIVLQAAFEPGPFFFEPGDVDPDGAKQNALSQIELLLIQRVIGANELDSGHTQALGQ